MELKKKLMQKIGIMSINLSAELMQFNKYDRIPTIAELTERYNTARGTIQSALKLLQEYNAIKLESRGQLGTFIKDINYLKLLQIAGIKSLVGVMPLPYSKRYEGLATGIFNTLNDAGINVNLAFMRGSNFRLKALKDGRYNFAITSRLAAEYYIKHNENIQIATTFGVSSYVDEHVLLVSNDFDKIKDEKNIIKVGIDRSSIDQYYLTIEYFKNLNVEYIELPYNQFTNALKSKVIDVVIWNKDDIDPKNKKNKIMSLNGNKCATEAVIIILKDDNMLPNLLAKNLDKDKVLMYQKKVLEGLIMPNY